MAIVFVVAGTCFASQTPVPARKDPHSLAVIPWPLPTSAVDCHWASPWLAGSLLRRTYARIVATGFAWLIRFRILTVNGLVFQTQVAYLIPIFGIIFGYFLMNEVITWKVIASLVVILIGIYIFKKNNKG